MEIHIFIARMGIGGAERVCVNLANEFVEKGNKVHIVVLNLENDVNTHLLDKRVHVHSLNVSREKHRHTHHFESRNGNQREVTAIADTLGHRHADAQSGIRTGAATYRHSIEHHGMAIDKGQGLVNKYT